MRYFTNHDGRAVLGPYTEDEIEPQQRAKAYLGWPDSAVYAVEAESALGAKAKVQGMLRRNQEN